MRTTLLAAALGLLCLADSAQADMLTFKTTLSGANEVPVNASPASGSAHVYLDTTASTMRVVIKFEDLVAPNTAAHIHCCTLDPFALGQTAGVATSVPTFTGFPTGTTAGQYDHTFDMTAASSYRAGFITPNGGTTTGAFAALVAGTTEGKSYVNIHSQTYPGGEIRGFLRVPEPATLVLLSAGLLGVLRRRRA